MTMFNLGVIVLIIFIFWIILVLHDKYKTYNEKTFNEEDKVNSNEIVEEECTNFDNDIQKKEQEEVIKMTKELKKEFYKFKENFKKGFSENLMKDNPDISYEDVNKLLLEIDFIELFYECLEVKKAEMCLEIIFDNCACKENVHNLAYELNSEYKILWDNLNPDAKKQCIKARKTLNFCNSVEKARWGFATMGVSVLGEKILTNQQNNKIKAYVTSEEFTNLCIIVNTQCNYYEKEGTQNEC